MTNLKDNPLKILIGRELSSVEFVRDYIQLRFDGPLLTIVTDPVLEILSNEFSRTSPGFCDGLCNLIGFQVIDTVLDDKEINLHFVDNQKIRISLNQDDRKTEESAIFDAENGKWWSW